MHHSRRICQEKHAWRANPTTQKAIVIPIIFFLIRRPLFLYFPYSVFSLLSRLLTGFLSLPICDLCFRFRLIIQRSFLFHFPVVDLFVRKMFFFRGFSFAVQISTPEICSLEFLKICSDYFFIIRFSFQTSYVRIFYLKFSFLSEVSHLKNIFLFPFFHSSIEDFSSLSMKMVCSLEKGFPSLSLCTSWLGFCFLVSL